MAKLHPDASTWLRFRTPKLYDYLIPYCETSRLTFVFILLEYGQTYFENVALFTKQDF